MHPEPKDYSRPKHLLLQSDHQKHKEAADRLTAPPHSQVNEDWVESVTNQGYPAVLEHAVDNQERKQVKKNEDVFAEAEAVLVDC
jgi:hypothetical protein